MKTEQYLRNPLYVEAVQVTEENFVEVANWCDGVIANNSAEPMFGREVNPSKQHIQVNVNNPITARQTKAYVGDWVLANPRGFKVYTDKAFQTNFEKCVPHADQVK